MCICVSGCYRRLIVALRQTRPGLSFGRKRGLSLWRSFHHQSGGALLFSLQGFFQSHQQQSAYACLQEDVPVYYNDFYMLTGTTLWLSQLFYLCKITKDATSKDAVCSFSRGCDVGADSAEWGRSLGQRRTHSLVNNSTDTLSSSSTTKRAHSHSEPKDLAGESIESAS